MARARSPDGRQWLWRWTSGGGDDARGPAGGSEPRRASSLLVSQDVVALTPSGARQPPRVAIVVDGSRRQTRWG